MQYKVLFINEDQKVTESYEQAFLNQPFETNGAASAEEALKILEQGEIGAAVFDANMGNVGGTQFITTVHKTRPDVMGILLTEQSGLQSAEQALADGEIFRFLIKPCNMSDMAATIRQAFYQRDLISENRRLLQISKEQFKIIKQLGQDTKGIFDLQKSQSGSIILNDPGDLNKVLKDLSNEIAQYEEKNKESALDRSGYIPL